MDSCCEKTLPDFRRLTISPLQKSFSSSERHMAAKELGLMKSRLQQARIAADHLGFGVAGDPREGRIDVDDAGLTVADDDAVVAVQEDRRCLRQLHLGFEQRLVCISSSIWCTCSSCTRPSSSSSVRGCSGEAGDPAARTSARASSPDRETVAVPDMMFASGDEAVEWAPASSNALEHFPSAERVEGPLSGSDPGLDGNQYFKAFAGTGQYHTSNLCPIRRAAK